MTLKFDATAMVSVFYPRDEAERQLMRSVALEAATRAQVMRAETAAQVADAVVPPLRGATVKLSNGETFSLDASGRVFRELQSGGPHGTTFTPHDLLLLGTLPDLPAGLLERLAETIWQYSVPTMRAWASLTEVERQRWRDVALHVWLAMRAWARLPKPETPTGTNYVVCDKHYATVGKGGVPLGAYSTREAARERVRELDRLFPFNGPHGVLGNRP